jgi:16S rRNA (uracil1498-N3)-methyltransferase
MRISRFFHPELLSVDEHIILADDATNHLANVLRAKVGQALVMFNGDGAEYSAHIIDITKRKVIVCIDTKLSLSVESPLTIHLGQGISRGDRMDWVIQKAVELGVSEITPLITERCGVKLSSDRWLKKHEQWHKLVIAACEQCGRNMLPKLNPPLEFQYWISQSTEQLRLTLHPRAETSFRHIRVSNKGVRLLIGPEGGFSEQEIYQTEESGFQTIQMGPRVLRTETAAVAAIAALQAIHGDL